MIYNPTPQNISRAAELIRSGSVVAFPTETVYGLGANALDEHAVRKIFALKGRPSSNPLIVHISTLEELPLYTQSSQFKDQLDLLARFWPGPLSIILPRTKLIPNVVTSGLDTVAIRIPNSEVALALISQSGCPIAAPSANKSGYVSPTRAEHVQAEFGSDLEMILDGGPSQVGLESTVLSLVHKTPTLLRPGAISLEQLQGVLGEVDLGYNLPSKVQMSPGLSLEHYSPHTPLVFLGQIAPEKYPSKVGLIAFSNETLEGRDFDYQAVNVLSISGNESEVGARIYDALRAQDSLGLDLIVVDSCAELELGRAIMDRLRRAATKLRGNEQHSN